MPQGFINWRIRRHEERKAEEARIKEHEAQLAKEEADRKERQEHVIRTDNQLMDRYETLERLSPKGGVLARISRHYDYYTSEWLYVMREDGSLYRTRDQDGATVEFENIDVLLMDFSGYRHHGFQIS